MRNIPNTQEIFNAPYEIDPETIRRTLDTLSDKSDKREQNDNKNEINMTEIITPYYVKDQGIFIPIINKVLAMEDAFDGEEVEWEDAIKAGAPTQEEWYIILYFKNDIQRLLEENGGQPLVNTYYWSSTEYSRTAARYVSFRSGSISTNYKGNCMMVRPIATYKK